MKTEAATLLELETLLDALDPEARKRAVDWIAGKYGAKAAPFVPSPLGPAVNPPAFIPVPYPVPMPTPHPDLGPSPWTWPGGTIITYGPTRLVSDFSPSAGTLALVASGMTDAERSRFTACAPSLPVDFITLDPKAGHHVFGPGPWSPAGDTVFRS